MKVCSSGEIPSSTRNWNRGRDFALGTYYMVSIIDNVPNLPHSTTTINSIAAKYMTPCQSTTPLSMDGIIWLSNEISLSIILRVCC
jgi:hypothetical protein